MRRRTWANGIFGGTPLEKDRLNAMEDDLAVALLQLARDPSDLFSSNINVDSAGAATSATVTWPDGTGGTYNGVISGTYPGSVDSYTITYTGTTLLTITQPTVTRDPNGTVINRPAMTTT